MTENMNEWIDKWMNEKIIKGKRDACLERIMNKQINEWINEWMKNEKKWIYGWIDDCRDWLKNKQMRWISKWVKWSSLAHFTTLFLYP